MTLALGAALVAGAPDQPGVAPGGSATPAAGGPAAPGASTAPTAAARAARRRGPLQKIHRRPAGSFSDSPIHIADDRGHFAAEGIEIETVRFGGSAELFGPLATGQLLVGTGGVNAALFNALSGNIGIQFVANKSYLPPGFSRVGWVVRTALLDDGTVREPRDLRGLNAVSPRWGAPCWSSWRRLLRRGNLTFEDVEIKTVVFADQPAAFANAALDVAYTTEPTTTCFSTSGSPRCGCTRATWCRIMRGASSCTARRS